MLVEYISDALRNIRNNKLRTALTMLGIVIGISSVIAVLTIGDGMQEYVRKEVGGFSGSMALIYLDSGLTSERLEPDDMKILMETYPEVKGVTCSMEYVGVVTSKREAVDVDITGGTTALQYMSANKVKYGRYFNDNEIENHARVCTMTERDSEKLFGTPNGVGKTVQISVNGVTSEFTVIGVKENYSDAVLMMLDSMEGYIAIMEAPYTAMGDAFRIDTTGFDQMMLFSGTYDINVVSKKAVKLLKNRHGIKDKDAIVSNSMADISDQIDTIMNAITMFMSFVAAISLLVGGIGVMNIMLVSVTERTREIGIRKSIGARTGAILVQFLAEASIISLLGGVVGVILGVTVAAVACHLLEFDLVVNPATVAVATLFSTLIGLFFGIHPARKAAKMKPIDALRF